MSIVPVFLWFFVVSRGGFADESERTEENVIVRSDLPEARRTYEGSVQEEKEESEEVAVLLDRNPRSSDSVEDPNFEAVNGSSLAFVFDSTGSMMTELNQVKVGASQILKALRDHPEVPIYNYILVPFNDPGIGPVTVTTNHGLFKESINNITVFGGGDCPEMSLGAIKKALEFSLPNSYVYVFTDAPAKDHRLINDVLALVQRKQTQVNFLMANICGKLGDIGHQVYENIVAASSGQMFWLKKFEVSEVLKYVKKALQSNVVNLLSQSKPAPPKDAPDQHEVVVDGSLQQFTLSVSGVNATISLTDPKGKSVDGPPRLESLLDLNNVKIVSVKEPDPGPWKIFISSDSNYRLRSTGLSRLNFQHGFTTVDTDAIEETNYRPLKGATSYLLIRVPDPEQVSNITSVDIVNLNGEIIERLILRTVPDVGGLYKTGPFVPPAEFFYLGVSGFDSDGLAVKRMTATAIYPQLPEKPFTALKGFLGEVPVHSKVLLKCHVESAVPVTIHWYKDGKAVDNQRNCSQTCQEVFHIESAGLESEGMYTCLATNIAGFSRSSHLLKITAKAPIVTVNESVSAEAGKSVQLECRVRSDLPFEVTWSQFTPKDDRSGVLHPVSRGVKLRNNTLLVEEAQLEDEGWYVCAAENKAGRSEARLFLEVILPMTVEAVPDIITYTQGKAARFECSATGKPEPTLEWWKGGRKLNSEDPSILIERTNGLLSLVVDHLEKEHDGEYTCLASNAKETAWASVNLIYQEAPEVTAQNKTLMAKAGGEVLMNCTATGEPKPSISWYKDGEEIQPNPTKFELDDHGILRVNSLKSADAGEYSCVAVNAVGSSTDYVGLMVGTTPTFLQKPKDKTIRANQKAMLPCSAVGVPSPEIKWKTSNGSEIDSTKAIVLPSGALKIVSLQSEDAGVYFCTAENVFGSISAEVKIEVYGVEGIPRKTKNAITSLKGQAGGEIVISCPAEESSPSSITWTKNGNPLPKSSSIFQNENGSLIIRNLSEENSGTYVCTTASDSGPVSKTITVEVQAPPVFTEDPLDQSLNIVEGYTITLNCNSKAVPKATVRWYKNGEPLLAVDGGIQEEPDMLRLIATVDDSGVYKCVATNEAGYSWKEFNVTVLVPPNIVDANAGVSIKAKAGSSMTLECRVRGLPPPTILWQRNGMYLTQNTSEITLTDSGFLILKNVTKESAGAYVCDAENPAGIVQRKFYLQVRYAPSIVGDTNLTEEITLKEGEEFSLPCSVDGNPKPVVLWKKNGFLVRDDELENLMILGDNTLVFLQTTKSAKGTYKCEATNEEGTTHREYEVEVITPPSLVPDNYHTRKKVNEGEPVILTCPVSNSVPPPTIQWIKDGTSLNALLRERSDEAQMKLSDDQRELFIPEAHPSDRGNYSCIATNAAGRADAKFLVDVLMTPHFEEFNHIAHRTILTGGEVALNCSVSGNPQPKITWRKGSVPVTLENSPGVHVSLDKQYLTIHNGKVHHSGTYICTAVNEVSRKEREFYVSVLEPPFISGGLYEAVDVIAGHGLSLHCPFSGVPEPEVTWMKNGKFKTILNGSSDWFDFANVSCEDAGIYACEVTNTAGTKTKKFNVTVLEPPDIESHNIIEKLTTHVGGNVSMKCKLRGHPKPHVTLLHNGRIINRLREKRRIRRDIEEYRGVLNESEDGSITFVLSNVTEDYEGMYTVLAANKAGVTEKNFEVAVLSEPKVIEDRNDTLSVTVVQAFPINLKCPVFGDPPPEIEWYRNGEQLAEDSVVRFFDHELHIKNSLPDHSGLYSCVAENSLGNLTLNFNVRVVEPPKMAKTDATVTLNVNDTLDLICNTTDEADDISYVWLRRENPVNNSARISVAESGSRLVIDRASFTDAGEYVCLASNLAGYTKMSYKVEILEAPQLKENQELSEHEKEVQLHHPISLSCPFFGHPDPVVTWYKDGDKVIPDSRIDPVGPFLLVLDALGSDAGNYTCVAENAAGTRKLMFYVEIFVLAGWERWSEWSLCSATCGIGEQTRSRQCSAEEVEDNVRIDSSECIGLAVEKRKCATECQIDGGWGEWSDWSSYSATCGKAVRSRSRICNNPKPSGSGKKCDGPYLEEEIAHLENCVVDGNWSNWSEWSECSRSCNGGVRKRHRTCDSPSPQHGGEACDGPSTEVESCNTHECEHEDEWSGWSQWSHCSSSCGRGQRKRFRKCRSERGHCRGENLQIQKCYLRNCDGESVPSTANFRVKGKLNGRSVDQRFDVNIENRRNERLVSANMKDLLDDREKWFPYAQFLLSPLSWSTAYENDNADNGYTLTNGNYFSQSDVKFATGEGLMLKHKGEGLDSEGAMQVQIEVIGEVPLLEPHASVVIRSLDQDFVQTSSNSLYSTMQNDVDVGGEKLPFTYNSSIHYNDARGTMPYLVEKLTIKDIRNVYNPESQNISYAASSSIGKRYDDNKCPKGFLHEPELMHCKDIDECEDLKIKCDVGLQCVNTFGSYRCACSEGFTFSSDLTECLDIDECSTNACSHHCHNTLGSYSCSCPYGFFLGDDLKNCKELTFDFKKLLSDYRSENIIAHDSLGKEHKTRDCPVGFFLFRNECKDRNECEEETDFCDEDEICLNTLGSYQCLNAPCPEGFNRDPETKSCVKLCLHEKSCKNRTLIREMVSYNAATLQSTTPLQDILQLNVMSETGVDVASTKFRVIESGELFRVRESRGKGSLYALRTLNKDTLFRVKVESKSFDYGNSLVYLIEFIIYIIVI